MDVNLSLDQQSFFEYQPDFSQIRMYSEAHSYQPEFPPLQHQQSFEFPIRRGTQRASTYAAAGETFEERLKEDLKPGDIKIPLSRTNYK